MKKLAIVTIGILAIFLFVVVQNNQDLKDERTQAEEKVKVLQEDIQALESNRPTQTPSITTIHKEAGAAAEQFVEAYFEYNRHPVQEEVETYVTANLMKDLSFQDSSGQGEYSSNSVESSVNDLTVYYGEFSNTSQTLLITFTNTLTYDGVPSDVESFLRVEMVKENAQWKADAMSFQQLG